jgi:hypothetical protein
LAIFKAIVERKSSTQLIVSLAKRLLPLVEQKVGRKIKKVAG